MAWDSENVAVRRQSQNRRTAGIKNCERRFFLPACKREPDALLPDQEGALLQVIEMAFQSGFRIGFLIEFRERGIRPRRALGGRAEGERAGRVPADLVQDGERVCAVESQ